MLRRRLPELRLRLAGPGEGADRGDLAPATGQVVFSLAAPEDQGTLFDVGTAMRRPADEHGVDRAGDDGVPLVDVEVPPAQRFDRKRSERRSRGLVGGLRLFDSP